LAEADAKLAKVNSDKFAEWKEQADWVVRMINEHSRGGYPPDVEAKMKILRKDKEFKSFSDVYGMWRYSKIFFDKAVQDLHKFEVANGFGEHQVHGTHLILWRCLCGAPHHLASIVARVCADH